MFRLRGRGRRRELSDRTATNERPAGKPLATPALGERPPQRVAENSVTNKVEQAMNRGNLRHRHGDEENYRRRQSPGRLRLT